MSKKKSRRRGPVTSRQRKSSSLVIPIVVGVVIVAIVVGVLLSIEGGQNTSADLSGEGLPPASTAQPLNTLPVPNAQVPRISLQEAQAKLEQGQAILVDVRSKDSYDKSHAVGAISIPEQEVASRLGELPRDKAIILYCT